MCERINEENNAPSCRLSLTETLVVINGKINNHSFEIIRDKMLTVVPSNMLQLSYSQACCYHFLSEYL